MTRQSARMSTTWWVWALVAAGFGVAAPVAAQLLPTTPSQLQAAVQRTFVPFSRDAGGGATSYRLDGGDDPVGVDNPRFFR